MILDRDDREALKFVDFVLMETEHINPELITHAGPSIRPYRSECTHTPLSLWRLEVRGRSGCEA